VLQRVGEISGKFLGISQCLESAHPESQLGQLLTCELGPEVKFSSEYLINVTVALHCRSVHFYTIYFVSSICLRR